MTLYQRIALVHPQRLPHLTKPTDVLTDVAGLETDRGIQIVTTLGVVLLPWSQVAHTLVALEDVLDQKTPPPIAVPLSPQAHGAKHPSSYVPSPKARR